MYVRCCHASHPLKYGLDPPKEKNTFENISVFDEKQKKSTYFGFGVPFLEGDFSWLESNASISGCAQNCGQSLHIAPLLLMSLHVTPCDECSIGQWRTWRYDIGPFNIMIPWSEVDDYESL